MSTAAPRRPSPANMPAHRPVPAPTFQQLYRAGIDNARLNPRHQLVAYALMVRADEAGHIPPHQQPRIVGLVHDTGLHAGQVAVALTTLRQRGWVRKARETDRYETADFILTIPELLLDRLRRQHAAQLTTTERTTDA
ncbi:hypothetical protein ACN6LM_003876 [Streptomyces sp. SAS_281]|uniref:hypothetical protein n=1 Tax=Streptomyces sp. SAS_281 TaxID=3412744 RepID=UPI00403C9A4C